MGLDITAYSKTVKTDITEDEYEENWEKYDGEHERINVNPSFLERADGLENGIYQINGESYGFKSGSYIGHGMRRNHLAQIAGYPSSKSRHHMDFSQGAWEAENGPFWEFINMSDCEGVIGPKTSAKLYEDFEKFEAVILTQEEDFQLWCQHWKRAFELAKDSGFVDFH